jgi:hypothetical protein
MKALDAFTLRDLQAALQINAIMAGQGITAEALREEITRRGREIAAGSLKAAGAFKPPLSFIGSGLWPPPARAKQRKQWITKLSGRQRAEYRAWRTKRLESEEYGRKKP